MRVESREERVKSQRLRLSLRAVAVVAVAFSMVGVQELRAQPEGFDPALQVIRVEAVTGSVRFQRAGQMAPVTVETQLQQGDTLLADVGSVCKLEFQHPESREVQSAVIVRGYTELTVAEAYQDGQQPRTRLEMPQGLIRAGVVRSAVPPSFRVRTPRTVVAVRGTEIKELESSADRGDILRMGRVGVVGVGDARGLWRYIRALQGTRKRSQSNRRETRLLTAIENAVFDHRVLLAGPHRRDMENDYARFIPFDPVALPTDTPWSNIANPGRERLENGAMPPLPPWFFQPFPPGGPPFPFPRDPFFPPPFPPQPPSGMSDPGNQFQFNQP